MENIQLSLFGKMCPEPFQATKARTSDACSKKSRKLSGKMLQYLDLTVESGIMQEKSWEMASILRGEYLTRNIGEFPSAVRESTLSQILEADAPQKYYLSKTACAGILRRAERRGKELPEMLREALMEVCKN